MAYIDITPTMTSDSAPSPNVTSASTTFGAGYEAYRAFDSVTATSWDTSTNDAGWVKLDFGASYSYAVTQYSIRSIAVARAPKTWTLQGSNNDSSYTTIDTQTGITFSANETKTYQVVNTTKYRYYKLDVTAVGTGGNIVEISEIKFYRTPFGGGFFLAT